MINYDFKSKVHSLEKNVCCYDVVVNLKIPVPYLMFSHTALGEPLRRNCDILKHPCSPYVATSFSGEYKECELLSGLYVIRVFDSENIFNLLKNNRNYNKSKGFGEQLDEKEDSGKNFKLTPLNLMSICGTVLEGSNTADMKFNSNYVEIRDSEVISELENLFCDLYLQGNITVSTKLPVEDSLRMYQEIHPQPVFKIRS